MKRPAMHQILFVIAACLTLLLGVAISGAQDENLLTNPGFEEGFRTVPGQPDRRVADGWNPWHIPATAGMPAYQNAQPEYDEVAPNTARIRSGDNAQMYFNTFFTHTGGIYQRVTGITPGTELRFSIYAYVWSSTLEDEDISESPGDVLVDVGIDPTGGTDGTSGNIIWSVPVDQYDAYRQYSVIAEAAESAVTVFVRSQIGFPVQNTYIYLDDAVLEVTTDGPVPADTDTPVPAATDTPEPTDTPIGVILPTDTAVPPTNTPAPTDTPMPTNTPEDPTPTREDGVIDVQPIETSTPAPTQPPPTRVGAGEPFSPEFPNTLLHTVQRGDTVGRLAVLYGSTTQAIIEANNLDANALIFIGQGLIIPVRLAAPVTTTPSPTVEVVVETPVPDFGTGGPQITYVVQSGDTLLRIANRYNTTIGAIAQLNGIVNVNLIRVGQHLRIPGMQTPAPPPAPALWVTYTVRPGDNLYRISLRFGVPLQRLIDVNRIVNPNLIFVGQVLVIPS
jgi:LysM repeat protein